MTGAEGARGQSIAQLSESLRQKDRVDISNVL